MVQFNHEQDTEHQETGSEQSKPKRQHLHEALNIPRDRAIQLSKHAAKLVLSGNDSIADAFSDIQKLEATELEKMYTVYRFHALADQLGPIAALKQFVQQLGGPNMDFGL